MKNGITKQDHLDQWDKRNNTQARNGHEAEMLNDAMMDVTTIRGAVEFVQGKIEIVNEMIGNYRDGKPGFNLCDVIPGFIGDTTTREGVDDAISEMLKAMADLADLDMESTPLYLGQGFKPTY